MRKGRKMKYEALFTIEISVGSELVANHKIKAHNVVDVVEKLAEMYLSDHEGILKMNKGE